MLQKKNINLSDVCYKVKDASSEILVKLKDTLAFEENEIVKKQEYCMLELVNNAKENILGK